MFKRVLITAGILLYLAGVAMAAYIPAIKSNDGQIKGDRGVVYGFIVKDVNKNSQQKQNTWELIPSKTTVGNAYLTIVSDNSKPSGATYQIVLPANGVFFPSGISLKMTSVGSSTVTVLYE